MFINTVKRFERPLVRNAPYKRSPIPHTTYVSLLLFSFLQDGSCNGLQHYAALGRDVIGATSVNLMPCDVPQDVYSGVAQQVSVIPAPPRCVYMGSVHMDSCSHVFSSRGWQQTRMVLTWSRRAGR